MDTIHGIVTKINYYDEAKSFGIVKLKIDFNDKPSDNVPPLLSAIEERERRDAAANFDDAKKIDYEDKNVREIKDVAPNIEVKPIEDNVQTPEVKKGRDLPAFMKKLLGRK